MFDPDQLSSAELGLLEATLRPPSVKQGAVHRNRSLRLLRAARDRRLISVVAPPGYGKSTLLAQWATSDPRPVAWLTVDRSHNDPVVLFTGLAAGLGRHDLVHHAVLDEIAAPGLPAYTLIGRFLGSVRDGATAVLMILDDAHLITDQACLDVLGELVERMPPAWQVTVAGRESIALPLARWRARRTLLEVGPTELAMDDTEAARLVRGLGLALPADDVRDLIRTSDGWPAIIYLAALAAGRSRDNGPPGVSGRHPFVADYLRSELLEGRSEAEVDFLTATSLLERLTGPLCDAVVARSGSARSLDALARSNLLVDEQGGWYRYHSLMRDFLRDELERREPDLAELHRRASAWLEASGDVDSATEHAFAAGDLDHVAAMVGGVLVRYRWSGRRATTRAWLRRFPDHELERRPWLAILAAIEEGGIGDDAAAERLADIVERGTFDGRPLDGTASFESGRAILRALMCRTGPTDMLTNASLAVSLEPASSAWRDVAMWALANARLIGGDIEGADSALSDAVLVASSRRNAGTWQVALAQRAVLAIDRGDWRMAASMAKEARDVVSNAHLEGYQVTALANAVLARVAIHDGDPLAAKAELGRAMSLRSQLTATFPWLNVAALVGLARAYLELGDPDAAATLLVQASDVVRQRPHLGGLAGQVRSLQASIAILPVGPRGASTLTSAELRVLAFLPLYLSFKEIGQRLGVRASTVQTHAMAIYGKLGASSRSEAVDRAIDARLLEGPPNWYPDLP